MTDQAKFKKIMTTAARQAGVYALREWKKFDRAGIKMKSKHEILTKVDLGSEKRIIRAIRRGFPDHKILSEEAGREQGDSEYEWIVDPIDGTTNFSMHNPLWAISIGLAHKGELVMGVVFAPAMDEMYFAARDRGAFLNNRRIRQSKISSGKTLNAFCHGSRELDLKRALKYYRYQKLRGFDCRQLGSASIELGFVAAGRIESIMIPGAHAWDVAAGVLLVREAGGRVSDFSGRAWGLESKDILASNRRTHPRLLKIIKGLRI